MEGVFLRKTDGQFYVTVECWNFAHNNQGVASKLKSRASVDLNVWYHVAVYHFSQFHDVPLVDIHQKTNPLPAAYDRYGGSGVTMLESNHFSLYLDGVLQSTSVESCNGRSPQCGTYRGPEQNWNDGAAMFGALGLPMMRTLTFTGYAFSGIIDDFFIASTPTKVDTTFVDLCVCNSDGTIGDGTADSIAACDGLLYRRSSGERKAFYVRNGKRLYFSQCEPFYPDKSHIGSSGKGDICPEYAAAFHPETGFSTGYYDYVRALQVRTATGGWVGLSNICTDADWVGWGGPTAERDACINLLPEANFNADTDCSVGRPDWDCTTRPGNPFGLCPRYNNGDKLRPDGSRYDLSGGSWGGDSFVLPTVPASKMWLDSL